MKTEPSTSSTTPPVLPKRGEPEINPPPSVRGNLAWGVHWPWHEGNLDLANVSCAVSFNFVSNGVRIHHFAFWFPFWKRLVGIIIAFLFVVIHENMQYCTSPGHLFDVLTHYFRWLNAKEATPQCTEAASLVSFALSQPIVICHQLNITLYCASTTTAHAFPFRVASMPAVRYDLSGGLPTCLWLFIYQDYSVICISKKLM